MNLQYFFYGLEGRAVSDLDFGLVRRLYEDKYCPAGDRRILEQLVKMVEGYGSRIHGPLEERLAYPTWAGFFSKFYPLEGPPALKYGSNSEILHCVDTIIDSWRFSHIKSSLFSLDNQTLSSGALLSELEKLVNEMKDVVTADSDYFRPITYCELLERPYEEGFKMGVEQIDSLTHGFQRGTIGTIAAYTGHGKTQAWVSFLYNNAKLGKKGVYLSLEMSPELIWLMLETRYMFEAGIQISSQDLIMRKLSGNRLEEVRALEGKFREEIQSNLLIVDSSVLDKQMVSSSEAIGRLYKNFESVLGGLDMVVWDHVNQLDALFPDQGNRIIKLITDAGVRYHNAGGLQLFTGFAAQCNREGWKYATRHKGCYQVTAISDLNEIERSSSYVVFIFSDPDYLVLQQTQVCMMKHRLGSILPEPSVIPFVPAVSLVGSNISNVSYEGGDLDLSSDSLDAFDLGGFDITPML